MIFILVIITNNNNNNNRIEIDIKAMFYSQEEQLDNIIVNEFNTFRYISGDGTYPNYLKWQNLNDSGWSSIDGIHTTQTISYNKTGFVTLACSNNEGVVLASLSFYVKSKIHDIQIVTDYDIPIDLNHIPSYDINLYFKVPNDSVPISSFKFYSTENYTYEQISEQGFHFHFNYSSGHIGYRVYDKLGSNHYVGTIYTIDTSQKNISQYIRNKPLNTTLQTQTLKTTNLLSNSRSIQYNTEYNDFFSKIKDEKIIAVIVDLPNIYMYGEDKNTTDNPQYVVLSLNMETFVSNIYNSKFLPYIDDKYYLSSNNDNFGLFFTADTFETLARNDIKLIKSYDGNTIEFLDNIVPVNVKNTKKFDFNKNVNYEYTASINNAIFSIQDNVITKTNNINDYYTNNLFWTLFNNTYGSSVMNYLYIPEYEVEYDEKYIFSEPLVYCNYFMQYLMTSPTTFELKKDWKVIRKQSFITNLNVKVLYTYLEDIDTIINNMTDSNMLYFNELTNKDINIVNDKQHVIEVNKEVNLLNGKVKIYVITDKLKFCVIGKNNYLTYSK